jgi:hypothetical protein
MKAAQAISNPYIKTEAMQYALDKQRPREITHK